MSIKHWRLIFDIITQLFYIFHWIFDLLTKYNSTNYFYIEQAGLFNLGKATILEEGKTYILKFQSERILSGESVAQ